MATHFPMEFTLESGTKVVVTKQDTGTYNFSLMPTHGLTNSFTYRDGEHTKAEWDALLEFEQLDALREFWLKTDDII
jgi:hypothetical protein